MLVFTAEVILIPSGPSRTSLCDTLTKGTTFYILSGSISRKICLVSCTCRGLTWIPSVTIVLWANTSICYKEKRMIFLYCIHGEVKTPCQLNSISLNSLSQFKDYRLDHFFSLFRTHPSEKAIVYYNTWKQLIIFNNNLY